MTGLAIQFSGELKANDGIPVFGRPGMVTNDYPFFSYMLDIYYGNI